MIRCKDVARALARSNYHDLSKASRCGLLAHITLCPCCGPFHRDVIRCQKLSRGYRDAAPPPAALSESSRKQLTKMLADRSRV
jgi:hypothetical protein